MVVKVKPKYRNVEPENKIRKLFYRFVEDPTKVQKKAFKNNGRRLSVVKPDEQEVKSNSKLNNFFEYFITFTILVNAIILTIKYPGISAKTQHVLDLINYVCVGIFVVEAVIKLTALGKNYFRDGWNKFDLIIVLGSLIFLHPAFQKQKNTITVIRTFRVGRILKLFNRVKQVKAIFFTIVRTLPALMNVGMLIMLIIYLFAIIGVQTFGTIKINGPMHDYLNFQTLPKAYLTLYRILTGENWNDLLEAVSLERSITNQCIEGPTY